MIDEQLRLLADDLYGFMKKKHGWSRDPKIYYKFDDGNAKRILGKTGYYDPDSEEIVIFCTARHPKDVLRSLAHELIHHLQKFEGRMTPDKAAAEGDETYILHDEFLKDMELEAYSMGNYDLREWEAHMKENGMNPTVGKEPKSTLEEKKKKKNKSKNKLSKVQLKKAKRMAASMEKKQGYSAEKAHKIAYAQVQKENKQLNEAIGEIVQPQVTVIVNDALKDSVVYNKDDRACNDLYAGREELIYQELLKKFGIKK